MPAASIPSLRDNLAHSNLLTQDQLDAVRKFVEQAGEGLQSRRLSEWLVQREFLTSWQARMLLAGRTAFFLGKYKLLDLLGHGGMGAVFKAEQTPLGRIVAVKMMAEKLVDDESSVARFRREIQAAAALNHPNIVLAFDADCVRNTHFLVMEYVEGEDLGTLLKEKKRLQIGTACEYVRQAALGLQHAFEQGMVHRDIKPSNLLLRAEPREGPGPESGSPLSALRSPLIKVLDFGLAKFESELAEGGELTSTGQIIGTPDYISPEQAQDTKHADIKSDVYSLGCTLFRLLTGRVPFKGRTAIQTVTARILHDAPSVREYRSEVSPELESVVAKMLARDPHQRYQTPADVAEALAPFAALTEDTPTVAWSPAKRPLPPPPSPSGRGAGGEGPKASAQSDIDPGLAQFLNNLATEAAQDEEPVQEDVSTQSLAEAVQPDATHPSPLPPLPQGEGTEVRGRKPPLTRAGKKLQQQLQARRQAERRRLLWTIAAVAAFLACIAGYAAWRNAGQTTLIVDLPTELRDSVTLEIDGRQVRIPPTGPLESRRYPGIRSLRLIREGYEQIEETWTLSRGEEKVYKVHWIPTPATARNLELAALEQRIATLASRGVNPPGPDESRPPAAAGGDEPRRSLDPDDPTVVQLRTDLLTFRRRHYAHPDVTIPAARLMSRLRWPADQLKRENIDPYELKTALEAAEVPPSPPGRGAGGEGLPELVAILGSSRLKHWGPVTSIAFSPDGKLLASAGHDDGIRIWDPATGKQIRLIEEPTSSLAFSPDGRMLAAGINSNPPNIKLWKVATWNELRTLKDALPPQIVSVAFSPDGKSLASASRDLLVRVWDVETGELRQSLKGHTQQVWCVAFSPDGKTLASGEGTPSTGFNGVAILWDLTTGREKFTLRDHKQHVLSVTFSSDGGKLATAGQDGAKLWDTATGRELASAPTGSYICFAPDGRTLGSVFGHRVLLWDLGSGKLRELGTHASYYTQAVAFSPDGKTLASADVAGTIRLWDVATGKEKLNTRGHQGAVNSVAVSPDGKRIVSASADGSLAVWTAATGKVERILVGHEGTVFAVAFAPDGTTIASAGLDKTIRLWDPATGRQIQEFLGHGDAVFGVSFSPDGRTLASTGRDRTVKLWDFASGKLLRTLEGHSGGVWCAAFKPDGNTIATASSDVTIRFWDPNTGSEQRVIQWTGGTSFSSMSFSPDGSFLVHPDDHAGLLRVVDAASGMPRSIFQGHTAAARTAAMNWDGSRVASAADDGTVRVWELRKKKWQLAKTIKLAPAGMIVTINQVAFTPDGRHLVTANGNGTVYVLRLQDVSEITD